MGFYRIYNQDEEDLPPTSVCLLSAFFLFFCSHLVFSSQILQNFFNHRKTFALPFLSSLTILLATLPMLKAYAISSLFQIKRWGFYLFNAFIVLLLGLALTVLVTLIFDYFSPIDFQQQKAVTYLITSLDDKINFTLALFSILFFAPLIEEILFRRLLYSFLKARMSFLKSLFLSSFLFSFLHLSWEQGFNNIPLFCSIFILGLYLAFIYEKTKSVLTSILVHLAFNAISVYRIIESVKN